MKSYLHQHATGVAIVVGALAGALTMLGMQTVNHERQGVQQMPVPSHSTSVEGGRHAAASFSKYFPND